MNRTFLRRNRRRLLGCFTVLVGLAALLSFTYCWGLWGRGSLLAQYLFQCTCPRASEPARYPEERVEVLIPACRDAYVSVLSPSRRMLAVREKRWFFTSTYLWNLESGEKTPFAWPGTSSFKFLTDNLVYVDRAAAYLLDLTTGEQYPIQDHRDLIYSLNASNAASVDFPPIIRPEAPDDFDPSDAASVILAALREAEQVYLVSDSRAVALGKDFRFHPERNFVLERFDIEGRRDDKDRLERFLQENNVVYQHFDVLTSPDGRFTAYSRGRRRVANDGRSFISKEGIYLAGTEQIITENTYSHGHIRGWFYDNSGAISDGYSVYLIDMGGGPYYDLQLFRVRQPVLKLKVPAEYLPSGVEAGDSVVQVASYGWIYPLLAVGAVVIGVLIYLGWRQLKTHRAEAG